MTQFLAQYYYGQPMMDRPNDWWSFGMMLFSLLFVVALVVSILYALKGHARQFHQPNEPLEIAKNRYAKGDITKEQFEQLKKDLLS